MKEPGHIYVMINPSIEGLLKIGKTTRDPESRAKELSQATGVATPFRVAFSIEVGDCHFAEEYVYAVLEHGGFNRTPNREFFEMPLRNAIEILIRAEKELRDQANVTSEPNIFTNSATNSFSNSSEHPGAAILEKAADAYYGLGGEIEDKKEALRLLNRAKALNFAPAYISLAEYFIEEAEALRCDDDFRGMQERHEEVLELLKEGARKGHGRCYVKMAEIYELKDQEENAGKCWKKYFLSETFINDDDQKWGTYRSIGSDEGGRTRIDFARQYLRGVFMKHVGTDPEILQILNSLRSEIIGEVTAYMNCFSQETQSKSLEIENQFLAFVESTL